MADMSVDVTEKVAAPAQNAAANDQEKVRVLTQERDAAKAENDDLRAKVKALEALMKEAEAKRIVEKAVAAGKISADMVEAAASPWVEVAVLDAKLAERLIDSIPAKAGNSNERVTVKRDPITDDEEAKLKRARELMGKENIDMFAALERID